MRNGIGRLKKISVIVLLSFLTAAVILFAAAAVWPVASGTDVQQNKNLTVDLSHASDGYIMVKGPQVDKRLKIRVSAGKSTLNYDLNSSGHYEAFPLQFGSGSYTIALFKNASGKKYSAEGELKIKVALNNENAAFLVPNQYVAYAEDSQVVALSHSLCEGLTSDRAKVDAVEKYITENYSYDFNKAKKISGQVMPDIDGTINSKTGICQDLSALTAALLRVQDIPTELVIGYANKYYHAWNTIWIDGSSEMFDPTAAVGALPGKVKYTIERFY